MPKKGPDAGIRERRDSQGNIRYEASFYRDPIRYYESFPSRFGAKPDAQAMQAARNWRAMMQTKAMQGTLGIKVPAGPLVYEDAVKGFLAAIKPHREEGTSEGYYRATLDQVWAPVFAGRQLASIRKAEIQAVVNEKVGEGQKRRSIDIYLQVLGAVFKWAMEPQGIDEKPYLTSSPMGGFRLPEHKDPAPKRFLRLHELHALLGHIPATHRLMFLALAYLGLRRSELYRMTWEWVDWDAHQLQVMKGKKGHGTVPIPAFLIAELRHEYMTRAHTGSGPYLFSPDGKPVDHRKTISAACKAAKIAPRGVGYHAFRHTLGTLLYREATNKDRVIAQRMLRHRKKKSDSTECYLHADIELDVRPALERLVSLVSQAGNVVTLAA